MTTYIFRFVPLFSIVVISTDISHQTETLGNHLLRKFRVLLAGVGCRIGKSSHQFQGILTNLVTELLVGNDTDAEFEQVVEHGLEHFRADLRQFDQRQESRRKLVSPGDFLQRGQNVEQVGSQREELRVRLLGDGTEERSESFHGSNAHLQRCQLIDQEPKYPEKNTIPERFHP